MTKGWSSLDLSEIDKFIIPIKNNLNLTGLTGEIALSTGQFYYSDGSSWLSPSGGEPNSLDQVLIAGNETLGNSILLTEGDRIIVGNNLAGLSKGTFDTGRGGDKGVSLQCAIGLELNWQAGYLRNMQDSGGGATLPIFTDSEFIYTSNSLPSSNNSLVNKDYVINGQNYYIVKGEYLTDINNGQELVSVYNELGTRTPNGNPLSIENQANLLLYPGVYDLTGLGLSTVDFVNIIGIGNKEDIRIVGDGQLILINSQYNVLKNFTFSTNEDAMLSGVPDTHARITFNEDIVLTSNEDRLLEDIDFWMPDSNVPWRVFSTTAEDFFYYKGTYRRLRGYNSACILTNNNYSIPTLYYPGIYEECENLHNGSALIGIGSCSDTAITVSMTGEFRKIKGYGIFKFLSNGATMAGRYIECENLSTNGLGYYDHTSGSLTLSGYFENCKSGSYSFGSSSNGIVNITGKIINCICDDPNDGNSFGYSTYDNVVINGEIINCIVTNGNGQCFGSSGEGDITINNKIINCVSGSYSFGFTDSGNVILTNLMSDCISREYSFGCTSSGNLTIPGSFNNCNGSSYCFGYSGAGNVNLFNGNGIVNCYSDGQKSFGYSENGTVGIFCNLYNCHAATKSFGSVETGTVNINGQIINCSSEDYSFGASVTNGTININGQLFNCKANGHSFGSTNGDTSGDVSISGILSKCHAKNSYCFGSSNVGNISIYGSFFDCVAYGGYSFCSSIDTGTSTITFGGKFRNCFCLQGNSFGSSQSTGTIAFSGGEIIDCRVNGGNSFGYAPNAYIQMGGGEFTGCSAFGNYNFGYSNYGSISGTKFIDCISNNYSFGSFLGFDHSGMFGSIFSYCAAGIYSFGFTTGNNVSMNGSKIIECTSSNNSFGSTTGNGNINLNSVLFKDCISSGSNSFGSTTGNGNLSYTSGIILNCKSYGFSFGYMGGNGTLSINGAIFEDCSTKWSVSDPSNSFGTVMGSTGTINCDNVTFRRCVSGDQSFCSTDTANINTTSYTISFYDCEGMNLCFGYSDSGNLDITMNAYNCKAGNTSFGVSINGYVNIVYDIVNCKAGDSSFGYTTDGSTLTISGNINGCIGDSYCFGYCDSGGTLSIAATINNCIASSDSFGCGSGEVSISGDISYCKSGNNSFGWGGSTNPVSLFSNFSNNIGALNCFGSSSVSPITISGEIINCKGSDNSYGYSDSDTVTISGKIINCQSQIKSFGYCGITGLMSGTIDSCIGGNYSFCMGNVVSGTLKNLYIDGASISQPSDVIIAAIGAKIEDCTVRAATGYYCISAPSSTTIRVLRSNFNLTTPYLNITNSITEANAGNLKDTGI